MQQISHKQTRNDRSLFSVCDVKLYGVSCLGHWLQAGSVMHRANIMCLSRVRNVRMGEECLSYMVVPAGVHVIADVSTVHLSTGMALMHDSETHQSLSWEQKKLQMWAKRHRPSGYMLLCCDWILNDGGECVYTVLSHEEAAVFDVGLLGKSLNGT